MTQRGQVRGVPRDFIVGGTFPGGRLAAEAPIGVRYAKVIAQHLTAALEGRTKSGLADQVGIARSTLHDVVTGRSWPDLQTLAALEEVLGVSLWPQRSEVAPSPSRVAAPPTSRFEWD